MRLDKANSAFRDAVVAALVARDGEGCWYCGEGFARIGERRCTVEHLIPIAAGGPRWADWNLVLAHGRCNGLAADARLAEKFAMRDALRRLGGYRCLNHRDVRGAIGKTLTARQVRKRRATQRAEVRWRFRASGAPGTAYRPLASLGELASL
jgi:hypothetical protein